LDLREATSEEKAALQRIVSSAKDEVLWRGEDALSAYADALQGKVLEFLGDCWAEMHGNGLTVIFTRKQPEPDGVHVWYPLSL
jgi:hypothetical protein